MDEGKRSDRIEISDIPGEIRELMLEEQTSMTDVQVLKVIAESRARVAKALKQESKQFHSYLGSSDEFLRSHLGSRVRLVILYADRSSQIYSYEYDASARKANYDFKNICTGNDCCYCK